MGSGLRKGFGLVVVLLLSGAAAVRATTVNGILTTNATWAPAGSPYVITGSYTVAAGVRLTVQPGTQIQLHPSGLFQINGGLFAQGLATQLITFTRIPPNTSAGRMVISGQRQGDALTSTVRLDYCHFTYLTWTSPSAIASYWADITATHSTFEGFGSTVMILTSSRVHVANCLFTNNGEGVNLVYSGGDIVSNRFMKVNGYADGVDLDLYWTNTNGTTQIVDVGWNILSNGSDPDADALDLGVANCLVHDNIVDQFGDKGISIGEFTIGRFYNNVISRCNAGLVVKDYSTPVMYNNTIVDCNYGETSYLKYHGPAQGSLSNSIIWDCATNIALFDGSTLSVGNCIMNGTVWPGPGNTNLNPLFVNEAARNYQIQSNSPAIDRGNTSTSAGHDFNHVYRPLDGNTNGVPLPDLGAYEFVHPTADSDGDAMPDVWEAAHYLNGATNDTTADLDGDGSDNWTEYMADTDPANPISALCILQTSLQTGSVSVTWMGGQNARQILYFSSNTLSFNGPWIALYTNNPPTPTNNTVVLPLSGAKGRFRIGATRL